MQSDDMKRIAATSADNVLMHVDATVIWRITDVETAALNSVETIAKDGSDSKSDDVGDIAKLRHDVLHQAEASLAAFIGAVNYSDTFHVAAVVQGIDPVVAVGGQVVNGRPVKESRTSQLFDVRRMKTCLEHANNVAKTYGVT